MNSDEPKPIAPFPEPEMIPAPESIEMMRGILKRLGAEIEAGAITQLSIYAMNRNGDYCTYQSQDVSRHTDAGRILELAIIRLGFVQREDMGGIVDGLLG